MAARKRPLSLEPELHLVPHKRIVRPCSSGWANKNLKVQGASRLRSVSILRRFDGALGFLRESFLMAHQAGIVDPPARGAATAAPIYFHKGNSKLAGFFCRSCNKYHDELPMALGPEAPSPWYQIPEAERAQRTQLSADQCVIDNKLFFVRGRIMLLVTDADEAFTWLAWVSVSKESFQYSSATWNTPGREKIPPSFGWLQSSLPYTPSTINLSARVRTMPVGERAIIDLDETDHPLALEQRDGISSVRLQELVEATFHPLAGSVNP